MNVFLKKVRAKTMFTLLDPVRVEPLELAYLQAAAEQTGASVWIIDELFGLGVPEQTPDVLVLTGYNTAEQAVLEETRAWRARYPRVRIIIGGSHAQCNPAVFHSPAVDFVVHSPDLAVFQELLRSFEGSLLTFDDVGVDRRNGNGWITGRPHPARSRPLIRPDRSLTEAVIHQTRYLDKTRVALVKGRTGCPFRCDFCYCRLLNLGIHVPADFGQLLAEAAAIQADRIWVVDDVFLASRRDALAFIEAEQARTLSSASKLKLIVYLRADFILDNQDLLPQLRACGLDEVIVGFEAVTNDELTGYNKQTDALDYPAVIRLLKKHQIDLTALFMVSPDYGWADFRRLSRFLADHRIDTYTISILTPIKGTESYVGMQSELTTQDPAKFDFLHLVTRSRLPWPIFYLLFWQLHLRLLKSRRIRRFIRQMLSGRHAQEH